MTYTEFIIEIENNIAKANCNKLNIGEYEEKQKQIYKQIRTDAIDEFARKLYEGCNEMIETCGSNIAPISWAEAYADFKVDIEEIAEQLKEQKK